MDLTKSKHEKYDRQFNVVSTITSILLLSHHLNKLQATYPSPLNFTQLSTANSFIHFFQRRIRVRIRIRTPTVVEV